MSHIVHCSRDLMLGSQVSGCAQKSGLVYQAVATIEAWQAIPAADRAKCRLVLLDLSIANLDVASWVAAVRQDAPQARVVAYGPHVHADLLKQARAAGCDAVVSRGQFHQSYMQWIADAAPDTA